MVGPVDWVFSSHTRLGNIPPLNNFETSRPIKSQDHSAFACMAVWDESVHIPSISPVQGDLPYHPVQFVSSAVGVFVKKWFRTFRRRFSCKTREVKKNVWSHLRTHQDISSFIIICKTGPIIRATRVKNKDCSMLQSYFIVNCLFVYLQHFWGGKLCRDMTQYEASDKTAQTK